MNPREPHKVKSGHTKEICIEMSAAVSFVPKAVVLRELQ